MRTCACIQPVGTQYPVLQDALSAICSIPYKSKIVRLVLNAPCHVALLVALITCDAGSLRDVS